MACAHTLLYVAGLRCKQRQAGHAPASACRQHSAQHAALHGSTRRMQGTGTIPGGSNFIGSCHVQGWAQRYSRAGAQRVHSCASHPCHLHTARSDHPCEHDWCAQQCQCTGPRARDTCAGKRTADSWVGVGAWAAACGEPANLTAVPLRASIVAWVAVCSLAVRVASNKRRGECCTYATLTAQHACSSRLHAYLQSPLSRQSQG